VRPIALLLVLAIQPALAQLPAPGKPGAIADPRYCGEPARYDSGRIKRSSAVLREFARAFPCPATLEPVTSCPGWAIDHTIPLASGGCDSVINLTWLPVQIKSCASDWCKDRWERTYNARPRQAVRISDLTEVAR
jgi:hypothetical protein